MIKFYRFLVLAMMALLAACASNTHSVPRWGYKVGVTPKHWYRYYPQCAIGGWQAPIDIPSRVWRDDQAQALHFRFTERAAKLQNDGHNFTMVYNGNGNSLSVGNKRYYLRKIVMHVPAETHITGQRYPMEWQFHYQAASGQWVIVASLVIASRDRNYDMLRLIPRMPRMNYMYLLKDVEITGRSLLPNKFDYYTFMGSLTRPPCTHNVRWYVLKQPIKATMMEINAFRDRYNKNVRPLQPLNGRKVITNN